MFSDTNSNVFNMLPVLLTCHNLIRLRGVLLGRAGSKTTLSGFKAFPCVVAGVGVVIAVPAPATQILPSISIAVDVAISFAVEPKRKFHKGAPNDE
ncbi:unannotated protein [freshwater metagenome]|uniref:Unannotated protein n=1 Tax=freshwater metagenome TaxID=449393 RepID=A0A6J6NZS0_9ZZZZ